MRHIQTGNSSLAPTFHLDRQLDPESVCMTIDPKVPESGLAYQEQYVMGNVSRCGLIVEQPIQYGLWPIRFATTIYYQDILLASKPK